MRFARPRNSGRLGICDPDHNAFCLFGSCFIGKGAQGGQAMRGDIVVGATFPDYELPDQTGTRRKLSELQAQDPMILILSRGHYCPKDRRQLRHLVDFYPELKVGYTRIVTISTDKLMATNTVRDSR